MVELPEVQPAASLVMALDPSVPHTHHMRQTCMLIYVRPSLQPSARAITHACAVGNDPCHRDDQRMRSELNDL